MQSLARAGEFERQREPHVFVLQRHFFQLRKPVIVAKKCDQILDEVLGRRSACRYGDVSATFEPLRSAPRVESLTR